MRKVLIIMEPDCLRYALVKKLQDHYEVLACGDAETGARLLADGADVIVLDLFLPGENGIDFLRDNQKHIPSTVIALTPFLSRYIHKTLHSLGVTSVIRKPCTVDSIVNQLKIPI